MTTDFSKFFPQAPMAQGMTDMFKDLPLNNDFTKMFQDLMSAKSFDQDAIKDAYQTWFGNSQDLPAAILTAMSEANTVSYKATNEALENLRGLNEASSDPSEFASALQEFAKKQMELTQQSTKELGAIATSIQSKATEQATKATKKAPAAAASKAKK